MNTGNGKKALDLEDQGPKAKESLIRKWVLSQRPIMAYVFLQLAFAKAMQITSGN